ncbi:MAG: RNA polymerase ECF-type sigma factor [uncultured Rubrobacteraceae bacterium]|uniref:RNA polymerase sigma factor n=1 Tax=uncultured Rubrobacteraceae bacterium TaxID=349277 RepID=A0A6J4QRU2_9ACTN|nr:MAG: RNA polymerase ECF-type sigma factor [uncultured Rubrobacteraceae bacterium]
MLAGVGPGVVRSGFGDGRREFGLEGVTDEVLMRWVAGSGNGRALSELYDRYGGIVYGMGLRYLGDRTLAEDLVQDVFLSVWRNAGSYDPSRAGFSTWIYRIARNRITDLARRWKRRVRVVAPAASEEKIPGEGDGAEEVLRSFDVVGALSDLSPVHREVLILAYFGGLSQREISTRTGTPLGTVKSRTTAALRAARKSLLAPQRTGEPHEGAPERGETGDG